MNVFDQVAIKKDMPKYLLKKGNKGQIIFIYQDGKLAVNMERELLGSFTIVVDADQLEAYEP